MEKKVVLKLPSPAELIARTRKQVHRPTKAHGSKRAYNRKRVKRELEKDIGKVL